MKESEKEKGCVYFFRHIGTTPIKIGYSSSPSPIKRFNQFKTYAPFGAEIVGFIQTGIAKEIETELHKKYSAFRLDGEWFEVTDSIVDYEIEFYSNKESVRKRNEFQIAWANSISTENDEFVKSENLKVKITKDLFDVISKTKHWNWVNLNSFYDAYKTIVNESELKTKDFVRQSLKTYCKVYDFNFHFKGDGRFAEFVFTKKKTV